MGLGSWLKSVGQKIGQATTWVAKGLPLVGSTITAIFPGAEGVVDTFTGIIGAVIAVEGTIASILTSNATGPDKARAAGNLAAQYILAAPFMHDKKIKDSAGFQKACATIAGGVADLLNSIENA